MLPLSLTVRNFLSYRDAAPTLRLEDVHVACLCGPNGNGKSALLDAITWVLWGRARGQRQDQLLHHGQDEMSVDLEFGVRDERYRVTRRYSKARKSAQTSLELAVDAGDGEYRPITGDTVRQTEAAITRLINMDYETFVNSSFLMQGRADMFTMSTPAQRKEVLSRVLGLGLYDRLEERAKLHGREAQGKLSASAVAVDRLKEQVSQAPEVTEAVEAAQGELGAVREAVASATERRDLLRTQAQQLARRREELAELAGQTERASARRGQDQRDASDLEVRIGQAQALVTRASEIEAGAAALERARERARALGAAAQQVLTLERELAPLDRAVTEARAGLERDAAMHRHRLTQELEPRVSSLPGIDERAAEVAASLAALDEAAKAADEAVAEHQRLALEAARLRQENDRLMVTGQETRKKLELLSHEHDDAECPLCGTALSGEALGRIQKAYGQELDDQRSAFAQQKAKTEELDKHAEAIEAQAREARQRVGSEHRALVAEQERLSVQRHEAIAAQAQAEAARAALAEAESALASGSYAAQEQAAATGLRQRIATLAFDAHAVQTAEREARELGSWEAEAQALARAKERLADDQAALERAKARVAEASEEITRFAERRGQVEQEIAGAVGLDERVREAESALATHTRRHDELQALSGSLAHRLEQIAAAEEELKRVEAERKGLVDEAGAYAELALAFGRGGVQALLIEAAIPRLEDEANALLRQMTDGRMSLKLETQRERRTGSRAGEDSVETLEIVIADELGTRPYELFSGGERFRIDFALRIALSKLLAWRAGAPLPTLFIDEGFGTQDAEGRDRVLDVIKAIEDRFDRILVITHMDDIKDAFPVRIEVARGPMGSTFSLS